MQSVEIIDYQPEYAIHFEQLNKAWIEEIFTLEPIDKYVLENPEEAIINGGGKILFAKYDNKIIGTAALKYLEPGLFELTKMSVGKANRGLGAGRILCEAAIQEAKRMNAQKVILYSNTRQSTAINIYRQLGFTELPLASEGYERANIKMELSLQNSLTMAEIYTLLDSYATSYDKVQDCLSAIPKDMWNWQPPYKKWTILQNIQHLADSEVNAYIRCRRFIAEPGSKILGYDQDKWANILQYDKQNVEDALELYRLLRKMTHALLQNIPNEMWENTVEHTENGTMKLWQWLRCYENHTHVLQMQRVYKEWLKANGAS